MRKELKDRVGRRGRFRATFSRFGCRRNASFPAKRTALFIEVRDESGSIVADHIWFDLGLQFDSLELVPGDEVFFIARVTKYRKRNPDAIDSDDPPFVEDYQLSYPRSIHKLGVAVIQDSSQASLFAQGGQ